MIADLRERVARVDRFYWWLGLITLAALALRVWYATRVVGWSGGDEGFYHQQANLLADGEWFVQPYVHLYRGELLPSAQHAPLWPLLLSVFSEVGLRTFEAHRIVGCLVGASTVTVIGLTGRRIAGARAGTMCAGLAAVYPNLWIGDGLVEVSSLYALLVASVLLLTYRWLDRPTWKRALALGLVVGAACLTRSEALLLIPLLALSFLVARPTPDRRQQLAQIGALALSALVIVSPWVVFNHQRFERRVLFVTATDVVVGSTNCARAYNGPRAGTFVPECLDPELAHDALQGESAAAIAKGAPVFREESVLAQRLGAPGYDYARGHLDELPRVALVRIARMWDLYQPRQNALIMEILNGRDRDISQVGQIAYYVVLLLAVGGVVVLRRRKRTISPLLVMIVLTSLTAIAGWGAIRLRMAGEVSLVLLAGCFLASLGRPSGDARDEESSEFASAS